MNTSHGDNKLLSGDAFAEPFQTRRDGLSRLTRLIRAAAALNPP
jgi:hypothetical protein